MTPLRIPPITYLTSFCPRGVYEGLKYARSKPRVIESHRLHRPHIFFKVAPAAAHTYLSPRASSGALPHDQTQHPRQQPRGGARARRRARRSGAGPPRGNTNFPAARAARARRARRVVVRAVRDPFWDRQKFSQYRVVLLGAKKTHRACLLSPRRRSRPRARRTRSARAGLRRDSSP